MILVIEGIDNSGKSTLAKKLLSFLPPMYFIQESEGPPKYPGELNERINGYNEWMDVVFVRHPCVSQPLYAAMRKEPVGIHPTLMRKFQELKPFYIYCHPPAGRALQGHVVKEGEDPKHLKLLADNYQSLLARYEHWAVNNAHINYRMGSGDEEWVGRLLQHLCLNSFRET